MPGRISWQPASGATTRRAIVLRMRLAWRFRVPPFRPSHVMFIRDYVGTLEDTWKPYLFMN